MTYVVLCRARMATVLQVFQHLKHGVGLEEVVLFLNLRGHAPVHDTELVEQAIRLRVVDEPLPGKVAILAAIRLNDILRGNCLIDS